MRVIGDFDGAIVNKLPKNYGDISLEWLRFAQMVYGKVASSNNKVSSNLRFIAFDKQKCACTSIKLSSLVFTLTSSLDACCRRLKACNG